MTITLQDIWDSSTGLLIRFDPKRLQSIELHDLPMDEATIPNPDILTMFHVPDDESFSLYLEVRLDKKDIIVDRNADELIIPLSELSAWIDCLTRARALLLIKRDKP